MRELRAHVDAVRDGDSGGVSTYGFETPNSAFTFSASQAQL